MDGSILNLHFLENSELRSYTWGNGFSNYRGTFSFPGNNGVEIHLEDQVWPEMLLSKDGDRFLLRRRDGSGSLISDGDIYPEAESRIFPFTQKMREDERDLDPDA